MNGWQQTRFQAERAAAARGCSWKEFPHVVTLDKQRDVVLQKSVSFHLERWAGAPDPREQEQLQKLKNLFSAILMEFTYEGPDGQR